MEPHEIDHSDVEHRKKYAAKVAAIGMSRLRPLIPVKEERDLVSLVRADKHLNNVPLMKWDSLHPRVMTRARIVGFKAWSLCDTVCTLKEAARQIAEEIAKDNGEELA